MDKLKFMEAIGNIDSDLIREADSSPVRNAHFRRNLAFAGAVAAAAVLTVGTGIYLHSQKPETVPKDTLPASKETTAASAQETEKGIIAGGAEQEGSDALCGTYWVPEGDHQALETTTTIPPEQIGIVPETIVSTIPAVTAETTSIPAAATESTNNAKTETAEISQVTVMQTVSTTAVQKGGVSAEECYFEPFNATLDPESDSFHEDEAHHIDIRTADGFYRQLLPDEYETHGINPNLSGTDFGAYIGIITETDSSDYQGGAAESQEPSLRGAEAYYYAPAGKNKAFILIKKEQQCSLFIADQINVSAGFKNGFAFFNVQSADDIAMIEAERRIPAENGTVASASLLTITDAETISIFYDLLNSLVPEDYSKLPPHIGTPQWLQDAWEAYRNNPQKPHEDYQITVTLQDGTVLQHITYQPFLGNGYVSGMEELTEEQAFIFQTLLHAE